MIREECSVCQVIGLARYFERAVAAVKEELTACPVGCFSLGMCDLPRRLDDSAGKWGKTPEAGLKQGTDRMAIEKGGFDAMGVAPLEIMSIGPDVVQVWGLPYQMEGFAYASVWDGADKLELSTNGHGASCSEVLTVPYLAGKVRLAITDRGDRWHGFVTEEEMILGCSVTELERLAINLWESMQDMCYPRNYDTLKLTYNPKYSARTYQGTA